MSRPDRKTPTAVLSPFNTLWAQVVRVGDPPLILTEGISVTYEFPDNTYSVGKSNFWDYDEQLFGVNLPPNVGLTGKGLAGEMDRHMERRPILCAECHASNALNAAGLPGVPNLSKAVHDKHAERVSKDLDGFYTCHPGPQTQCLRDTMSQAGMDCIECHGDMAAASENQNPWLNEPRCDNAACHGGAYQQDQPLYRTSKEHAGVYCAACHDSPYAITPSREPNDNVKFVELQGHAGTLKNCTVCHATEPSNPGPHGMDAWVPRERVLLPILQKE